jgi:IS5 family transposase
MQQLTLAAVGLERYAKTTRRAAFLAEMERVVPWSALCALIEPFYPSRQWPPAGQGRADAAHLFLPAMVQSVGPGGGGDALRFSGDAAFCRHRPGREPVPDETTVCRFRHLLEEHDLGRQVFDEVQGTWWQRD